MPNINDSRCVLVIGATSGIGRALALAIHSLPSNPTVIVAGRRQERLDELHKEGKKRGGRLDTFRLDATADAGQLKTFVDDVTKKHPQLDTIIFSAGVQHEMDFARPEQINLDLITQEFTLNYVSVITLITYFLPHLLNISAQGRPTFLIPISSFLGVVPRTNVPNYCATKVAIHSLCISLRLQLKHKGVHVIEILPPLVESELHDHQGLTPHLSKFWMPLDDFTKETLEALARGDREIFPQNQEPHDMFEKGKIDFVEQQMTRGRPKP